MFQREQGLKATQRVMSGDLYIHLSQVHEPLLSPPSRKLPSAFSPYLRGAVRVISNQNSIEDLLMASSYKSITSPTSRPTESESFRIWNPEICTLKYSPFEAVVYTCFRITDLRVPSLLLRAWGCSSQDSTLYPASKQQVSCSSLQLLKPYVNRATSRPKHHHSTQPYTCDGTQFRISGNPLFHVQRKVRG